MTERQLLLEMNKALIVSHSHEANEGIYMEGDRSCTGAIENG